MLFSILGPGTAYVWLEELFFLYITSCFCAVNRVCPIARLFTGMKDFGSYRERCVWGPKSGAPFWYTFGECRVEQGEAGAGSTALCTRGKGFAFWGWDLHQKTRISSSSSQSYWFSSYLTGLCNTSRPHLKSLHFYTNCHGWNAVLSDSDPAVRWQFPPPRWLPHFFHPSPLIFLTHLDSSQKDDDHKNDSTEKNAARVLAVKGFCQVSPHRWRGWAWQSWSLPQNGRENVTQKITTKLYLQSQIRSYF